MDFSTKKCDQCGKLRANDTNHWLAGRINTGSMLIVIPLTDDPNFDSTWQHFCGQNCATQWFATEVGKLK